MQAIVKRPLNGSIESLLNWQMKIKILQICQLFALNFLENIFYFDLFSDSYLLKKKLKRYFCGLNPKLQNIEIIKKFNLSPHPEGGWLREIVSSKNSLIRGYGQSRNIIRGIYYLLERDAKSAWHRVKNADEIWIYLRGDPLNLWCLD